MTADIPASSEVSAAVGAVAAVSVNNAHDADIDRLFGSGGPLGPAVGGYRPRQSQTEMAKAVARAIAGQTTLMAEAGTGTGKTFAYLVPALLWGGKVIVSTGTKNLQDQLYLRDIPTVRQALGAPVSVALLKGRANYVCHYHLERTLQNGRLTSRDDVGYLREIARFTKTTMSGDKAELSKVPENALIWNLVTSTRDTCLGAECQYYQDCFVMKARKEAQQADVVVVNHHLFFADVALKDTGVAEVKIQLRGTPSRCLLKIGAIDNGVWCSCSDDENASTHNTDSTASALVSVLAAGLDTGLAPASAVQRASCASSSTARVRHCSSVSARSACFSSTPSIA